MQRAAVLIDVGAVGIGAQAKNLSPQLFQGQGGHFVAGAVGAVHHNTQAGEGQLGRKAAFGVHDVAAARIFYLAGPPYSTRIGVRPSEVGGKHHAGDFVFGFIGQFVAFCVKELDAVVLKRIVRSRNDHAQICTHAARKKGYGRRGQRTGHDHMHAGGAQPCRKRRLKHIA